MNAQEYILNIRPGVGYAPTVKISQYDIGRPLQFHLYDGTAPLAIATGTTIKIHATKPSGLGFEEACTWSGSSASIDTTESMTQEYGIFPAELELSVGGDIIGTANFMMHIERSPHPEGTTDGVAEDLQDIYEQLDDLKDEISELGGGLSEDVKLALLQLATKVAYIDDDGEDYYQALYDAFYPPLELVSISAAYTQSDTVYDTDTLDSLKANLVVTATYEDSSTETISSGYTLSGSLTTGTSTITVSYGGKTDTFTVTVTHDDSADWDTIWKYEDGLPPVSDFTWSASGGSGQVHSIVSDGMKVTAKSGTSATYTMPYEPSAIASSNGGILQTEFYIPSSFAVATAVNAIYYQACISDGTNGLRVGFLHKKNNSNALEVRLYNNSDLYSATVLASFSYDTPYTLRLEIDTANNKGKVVLNGTTLQDNIDLSTIYYKTTVMPVMTSGGTVNSAGIGSIVQSIKVKHGLS